MTRILAACSPGEVRVAVEAPGAELLDYAIWRPGAPDGFGDVFAGRVIARVPAMAGAFVALPDAEGFLPDTAGAPGLSEGEAVTVRVVRAAQGGKGPRLALLPEAASGAPALIRPGESPLHRLAARFPEAPIEIDDAARFADLRAGALGPRLVLVAEAFSGYVADEVDALEGAWWTLEGGVHAGFFPSPALTAIDMDGGRTTSGRGEKFAAQFAANRAALPGLARQIRLRNLSGAILVDFAGLPIKRRESLGPDLTAALQADPARPRLLGFTQLGLAEILRPRTTPPLHELLAGPHAAGLAALRAVLDQVREAPGIRPILRAAPAVVAVLQNDTHALADFARLASHKLDLRSDPTLPNYVWTQEFP